MVTKKSLIFGIHNIWLYQPLPALAISYYYFSLTHVSSSSRSFSLCQFLSWFWITSTSVWWTYPYQYQYSYINDFLVIPKDLSWKWEQFWNFKSFHSLGRKFYTSIFLAELWQSYFTSSKDLICFHLFPLILRSPPVFPSLLCTN